MCGSTVTMREKRGFVCLGSETQKLINCKHVTGQRVFSLFFPVKFNKIQLNLP